MRSGGLSPSIAPPRVAFAPSARPVSGPAKPCARSAGLVRDDARVALALVRSGWPTPSRPCLLYTSDAADDM
eukprot:9176421-Alexandrium_andersonii.AAC.1